MSEPASTPLQARIFELVQQRQLLLWPEFLSPAQCQDLRLSVQQAPAQIAEQEHYGAAEKQIRKSQDLDVPVSDRQMLKFRLEQAAATLFQHFQIQASRQEQAQFLRYLPGDYFKAHRDWTDQEIYRDRILSLVLFLNDHSDPEGFKGGRFSFLLPHPADSERLLGVPIYPQTGLLIAFRPQLLHEVSPVTAGQRYTVVTWLSR